MAVLGDTPAAALMGGFKEGVGGATRGCRTCMIKTEELCAIVSNEYQIKKYPYLLVHFHLLVKVWTIKAKRTQPTSFSLFTFGI